MHQPLLMHLSLAIPWGGTPGKGGDFIQDPVEVLEFPLLEGDTECSARLTATVEEPKVTSQTTCRDERSEREMIY